MKKAKDPETGSNETHETGPNRFNRILVAVDGSENSIRAARAAMTLCERLGADLSVIQAIPKPETRGMSVRLGPLLKDYYAASVREAEKNIQRVVTSAQKHGLKVTGKVLDYPSTTVEAILDYAAGTGVDLIVVGTRGLGGFTKLIMGSVSTAIVNHASCSVLVVR
jgi:nucleotide-binding universal stress UspA family protein